MDIHLVKKPTEAATIAVEAISETYAQLLDRQVLWHQDGEVLVVAYLDHTLATVTADGTISVFLNLTALLGLAKAAA